MGIENLGTGPALPGSGSTIALLLVDDGTHTYSCTPAQLAVALAAASAFDPAGAAAAVLASSLQKSANLSDLASAPTARSNLGLGTAALAAASAFDPAGAAAAVLASSLQQANNLSDVASAATARSNLGLAGAAVLNVGTTSGTVAAGNDSRIVGAVQSSTLGAASGVATLDGSGKLTSSQIPSALIGAVVYQGTWNASTNSPTLTSSVGTQGYYYVVSAAGTTTLNDINSWAVGDTVIFNGTVWDKIEGQGGVETVNGHQGPAVTLSYTDVGADAAGAAAAVLATSLQAANNLSDLTSAATARSSLGLGTAATQATGAFLQTANNLSDIASVPTSRANLLIDKRRAIADAAATISATDGIVSYTSITTSRIATLSASSGFNPGQGLTLKDESGSVTQAITLTLAVHSGDYLDGVLNGTQSIYSPYGQITFFTDGAGHWYTRTASPNIQVFLAGGNTTWVKPPWASVVKVVIIAPGGAGGSGAVNASSGTGVSMGGGGGGGSGGVSYGEIPAAALPSTVTVTVPTAPTGGASVTVGSSAASSGNPGGAAVTASFGTYVTAQGGSFGGGGGINAAGSNGTAGTGQFAGAAGTAGTGSGIAATQPTTSAAGPGAGCGGSGFSSNGAGAANAGNGGTTPRSAGATGAGLGGTSASPNGTNGSTTLSGAPIPGAGGGGGCGGAGSPAVGGNGGNGGGYGGGGAGGGAAWDSTGNVGATCGAGGNGGPGIIVVTSW